MASASRSRWGSIDGWSPTLFLVGGILLIGHATVQGIEAFTTVTPPPDVFVTTGHLVALVGLLGLCTPIRNRQSRTGLGAVLLVTVSILGWGGLTIAQLAVVGGYASSLTAVFSGPIVVLVPVSTILAYGSVGAAIHRTGASRAGGLLVAAPGVLLVVLLVDSALTGASAVDGVLIGGGLALLMLGLGTILRAHPHATTPTAPTGDVQAG